MKYRDDRRGLALLEWLVFLGVAAVLITTLTTLLFGAIETLARAAEREQMEVRVEGLRAELSRAWERRARFAEPTLFRLEGSRWNAEGESLLEVLQFPYFSKEGLWVLRLSRFEDGWELTIEPQEGGAGRGKRLLRGIGRIAWHGGPIANDSEGFEGPLHLRFPDISSRPHETIALW